MNPKIVCDAFAKIKERNNSRPRKFLFPLGIKRKSVELFEKEIDIPENNNRLALINQLKIFFKRLLTI